MKEINSNVLAKILDEIRNNSVSVAWNYGFDTVLFINKSVDGRKSLEDILRENLSNDKD